MLRGRLPLLVAVLLLLAGLTACSQDDSPTQSEDPAQVLETAKQELDDTEGVQIALDTDDLPAGVQGVLGATGVATHAPAFDGTITVPFAGSEVQVPVRAVDGKVWAQIPGTAGWSQVNPEDYHAPDPAGLMAADAGVSSLLVVTDDPERGDSVRGGADNDQILTTFTGTVPGAAMKKVIPSATGDTFHVTYEISDAGELRKAVLTGVFYPDSPAMTYTITLDDYGTSSDITPPV